MKRIATLVAMTCALSGCVKDMDNPESVGSGELMLNASIDGMTIEETRAAATDADLKTYGFYLAGYHTADNMSISVADAYPNVFNQDAQDAQDPVPLVKLANNKFTLKTIKWALDETSYLSFFGWSQSKAIPTSGITTATTGIFAFTQASTDKGYPWIDIRNADAPGEQTDVVGSRSLDHRNDAVLSAVDLDFRHVLSKLTFKARSSSGANILFTAVNLKYATNKVYKKARYTFSSDVTTIGAYGAYAEYHAGSVALGTSYPAMTNGAEVTLGCGLLIPQALVTGDVTLEIKYKLSPNSGSLSGDEQTKTLPLSALTLAQGKNYIYTIDVQATGVFVMADPVIEAWSVSGTSLPVVPGPKGNVLLLLDGHDKPYQHTDGKQYWLDRSGYNRHVALEAGYVSYNSPKHGYVFQRSARGGIIPDLGSVSALSVDLVAEGNGTATDPRPFALGDTYLQLPISETNIDWNYPGGYLRWAGPSREIINRLGYWNVTWGNSRGRIYHNSLLRSEKSAGSSTQALATNYLSYDYEGRISYLRVTSTELSQADINAQGEELSDRFGTPQLPTFTISSSAPGSITWKGATYTINITSSTAWQAVASNATVTATTGTGNMSNFKITVPANPYGSASRTAQVVFSTSETGSPAITATWSGTQQKSYPDGCHMTPLPGYNTVFVAASSQNNSSPSTAIYNCNNWGGRLPTLDELKVMYNNKSTYNSPAFIAGWYWSSTTGSGDNLWLLNFATGATTTDNGTNATRCVKDLY